MNIPFHSSPLSKFPSDHRQIDLIRNHLTRAMQDLFLLSVRNLDNEFLLIFDSEKEIDELFSGMVKYREEIEEYEICEEIIKRKPDMIIKWKETLSGPDSKGYEEIRAWLKSTI